MLLPDTFILPATNAEPFAPSNPSPASSTSTATTSPGSTQTDNLRIQHRSTQGRPKAQHPGCSYAICAHHTILLSINTLPPPTELHCKDVLAPPCATKTFFEVFLMNILSYQKKNLYFVKKLPVTKQKPRRGSSGGQHRMRRRTVRRDIHDILSKSVYLALILDVPKSDKFPSSLSRI